MGFPDSSVARSQLIGVATEDRDTSRGLLRRGEPDKTHNARVWLPSYNSQLTEVLVNRENNPATVLGMRQDGGITWI